MPSLQSQSYKPRYGLDVSAVRRAAAMNKPRLFIGSSTESLSVAYEIQKTLEDVAETTVWNQGIFSPNSYTLLEIEKKLPLFDFAAFVFDAEDFLVLRGQEYRATRDNVILEFGFSVGTIGRFRTYIVAPRGQSDHRMPTDLLGLKLLYYSERSDSNLAAALGPACHDIRNEIIRLGAKQQESSGAMVPSGRTPQDPLVDNLIVSAIHVVCRAVSVPQTPESAKLRAFIFRKIDDKLICSHFWAPNPVREMVGLKFDLTDEVERHVAVVQAARENQIVRRAVDPLPPELGVTTVDPELRFVLAVPIVDNSGNLLGVVDFDTANEIGMQLLNSEVSDATMYQLSKHIGHIFSFKN
jgi:predicted nucleotide-binding protein